MDPEMEPVTVKAFIIQIHGGGFIGGSSASSRLNTIDYSTKLGVPVFSLDYRTSPENKFP